MKKSLSLIKLITNAILAAHRLAAITRPALPHTEASPRHGAQPASPHLAAPPLSRGNDLPCHTLRHRPRHVETSSGSSVTPHTAPFPTASAAAAWGPQRTDQQCSIKVTNQCKRSYVFSLLAGVKPSGAGEIGVRAAGSSFPSPRR